MFIILAGGFFYLITFEPDIVSATVIYVGTGPGNDTASIQDAIDNFANDGDTIFVYSGTYFENIFVNESINLTGEDRDTTIIDGGGIGDVVSVNANWVNLSGFTVRNGGLGPWDHDSGIEFNNVQRCSIINNNVSLNNDVGIHLSSSSNNTITGNNISNNNYGIRFDSTSSTNITGNNISNNMGGISYFESSYNNIISNKIFSNFGYHIDLGWSSYNNIIGNDVSNLGHGIVLYASSNNNITSNNVSLTLMYGISLAESSSSNTITGNNISNNWGGICIDSSCNNTITDNNFTNDGISIFGYQLSEFNSHHIPTNNIVNGKPLYYYKDCSGVNIDGISLGQLILANCTYFDVKNLQITHTDIGIEIAYSTNINITNNNVLFMDNMGIYVRSSSNNTIIGNTFFISKYHRGIYLSKSSNINIINNNVINSDWGIYLSASPNNNIIGNYLSNNHYGIALFNIKTSSINIINNIVLKSRVGIHSVDTSNNTITGNIVSNNEHGLYFSRSSNNIITNNIISDNTKRGISMSGDIYPSSSNNSIYHNNIKNNTNQAIDDTNNENRWDNGYPSGGNYWSDYQGIDLNSTATQDVPPPDGIGDTPYVIDSDSQDNYPLMEPVKNLMLSLSPPTLFINVSQDGKDVILYWDPPSTPGIDHYLIYRSTSQIDFNFSHVWVNTSSDMEVNEHSPIPLRIIWNDTNAAFPENATNYEDQYYYIIRAVNNLSEVSRTSRTVGKWTKTFQPGVSTFSLPLEPLEPYKTDYYTTDMNTDYIKYMDSFTHTWVQHNLSDGTVNNVDIKLGEGYEVKFGKQTNYTFTGMPGAMIIYDDGGFLGFDPATESKNISATVDPDGIVTLTWQEPASMVVGDWYEVYYSNTRDGFYGELDSDYFLAGAPINFGSGTATFVNARANDPERRLYYMIVPFNTSGVRGSSTFSIGIWTEEYLPQYDTFGQPLKLNNNQTADWYCENIPDTVGINYYDISSQWWCWHPKRMPAGAYDPVLEMTEGYQISTSNTTKFTFIGV